MGPAEGELKRAAGRHALLVRTLVLLGVQIAALLVVPREHLAPALVALGVTLTWSLVLHRVRDRSAPWTLGVDVTIVACLGLTQGWTDSPVLVHEQCGWVAFAAETVVLGHPLVFSRRQSVPAAVIISGAYAAGALLAHDRSLADTFGIAVWILVAGLLATYMSSLMNVGVRAADAVRAETDQTQREVLVAEARRRSEAEHLATLHDTVAATLMMVGLGVTSADHAALRRQAARDLEVLAAGTGEAASGPGAPGDAGALGPALREAAEASGLQVERVLDPGVPSLPPDVVQALAGAAGEALRNVARHSGTRRARIETTALDGGVLVEVRDHGTGFGPGVREGRGIRCSILDRMEHSGGAATVTSTAEGVHVRLSWTAASAAAPATATAAPARDVVGAGEVA